MKKTDKFEIHTLATFLQLVGLEHKIVKKSLFIPYLNYYYFSQIMTSSRQILFHVDLTSVTLTGYLSEILFFHNREAEQKLHKDFKFST